MVKAEKHSLPGLSNDPHAVAKACNQRVLLCSPYSLRAAHLKHACCSHVFIAAADTVCLQAPLIEL